MHRALLIPEILHAVCVYATDATLVSLARSCKVFHEVAIQVLWDELRDLSPLIKCFPEDAWTVDQEHVRIVRCLPPDDWANFLKYSSHVRHIGKWWTSPFGKKKCLTLDRGAISSLSIYRPILVLFPRLVELSWKDSAWPKDDRDLPTLLGMIGPHLKKINIMDWSLQDDYEQYLQTSLSLISTRFRSLQAFYFHCKQTPAVCRLIPEVLPRSLDNLRYFHCSRIPTSENAFLALGRLQHLRELSIRLPALLSWAPLPPDVFLALCKIEITGLTRDYLALNANIVRFPQVHSAIIYLHDVPEARDGLPFFDLISRQFSHVVLSGLSVYMSGGVNSGRSQRNRLTITRDNLRPLLSFTKMTDISIDLACPYALDGDFYSEIAQAFPEIESLFLGTLDYCYHEPSMLPLMTQVLAPLATYCPKLSSLGIAFDARQILTVNDVRDALPQRPSLSPVTLLHCTHCPIDDAHVVAAYLTRVFPMLDGEEALNWHVLEPPHPLFARWRDWERIWTEVEEKLPWFAMIRNDERATTEEE